MKRFSRLVEDVIYICGFPLIFFVLQNSRRSRVVIRVDNRVLLVRPRFNLGCWTFPGGGMHKNESPEASAVREVREEIGVEFESRQLVFIDSVDVYQRFITTTQYFFEVSLATPPTLTRQSFEIAEAKWFSREEISQIKMLDFDRKRLELLLQDDTKK